MPSFALQAQSTNKVFLLGYLSALNAAQESANIQALRNELHNLGYAEGQNLRFEFRFIDGKFDRAPALAAELAGAKVDVIVVTGGTRPVRAVQKATKIIPIVMASINADPVESGLVKSLAQPGGNITGLTTLSRELGGKRLELIKEALPKISRVAVLYSPVPQSIVEVKDLLPPVARALGVTMRAWEVRSARDLDKIVVALVNDRAEGLYVTSGGGMNREQKKISALTLKNRLPAIHSNREIIDAGGLMYYGADLAESHTRLAYFIDRIFRGAKPIDLPVERPTKFEFVVNQKISMQIGVTIAPAVLMRATKIIR